MTDPFAYLFAFMTGLTVLAIRQWWKTDTARDRAVMAYRGLFDRWAEANAQNKVVMIRDRNERIRAEAERDHARQQWSRAMHLLRRAEEQTRRLTTKALERVA